MRLRALVMTVGLLVSGTLGQAEPAAAGRPTHALIQGTGSSWAANAINQWISDVDSQGIQVVYTGSGSAQGRKDFANGTTDFAASDITYQGERLGEQDTNCVQGQPCREFRYTPIAGGGTSFPYQLKVGGRLVRNLRLSGQTLAKIFTNTITNWNDKQISADNNGRTFPSLRIIPVVHSEGAGSTARFTSYLDAQYPDVWRPFFGRSGSTEFFPPPKSGQGIAQSGSDGVMNFVSSSAANGAIGYDEYAYPLAKGYPVAKVENSAGFFVLPNSGNVSVALRRAIANPTGPADYSAVFTDTDPRTYPLSSYTMGLIPTGTEDPRATTARRQTLVDYLTYAVCQGQKEMAPIGYAPLPLNLTSAAFDTLSALHDADPDVDLTGRNLSTCHNPTFTPGDHPTDTLESTVAKPPSCDRAGQGPCSNAGTPDPSPPTARTALALAGGGTIHAGSVRTLTGALQTAGGTGSGLSVGLYAATPHHGWHRVTTMRSDRRGTVRATVRPTVTTRYQARFSGNGQLSASTSNSTTVTVNFTISAKLSRRDVHRAQTVVIAGRVAPGRSGDPVTLQRFLSGHWRGVDATVLRQYPISKGHRALGYRLRFTPRIRGTYLLRVTRPATPANGAGASATVRLRSR